MQKFFVKYKDAGRTSSVYIEARNEAEAGKAFAQQYSEVCSEDVLSVAAVPDEMPWLHFSRHIVGASIVAVVAVLAAHPQEMSSATGAFGYALGALIVICGFCVVLCAGTALFFTDSQRGRLRSNFVNCFWVVTGLIVLGAWLR